MIELNDLKGDFNTCLDDAFKEFKKSYDDKKNGGIEAEMMEAYMICKDELEEFKSEAVTEMEQ